jgi:2-amino-4-hydroxy-6-hydroxymethyldihydropteridine diphosphokinase
VDRVATPVAIALGSNLGDRLAHLTWAVDELSQFLGDVRVSTIIETEPVGVPDLQPPFLNAVVVGRTSLEAQALLTRLLDLERRQGRERPYRWSPRTLDLDLILYGDLVSHDERLTLPHPRFRERRFVLGPLAEVWPEAPDPVTGLTAEELLRRFDASAGGAAGTAQKDNGRDP